MFVFEIQAFLFIFARITSFIVVVPGFSHKSLPNTAKVAFCLVLSWFAYSRVPQGAIYEHDILFMLGVVKEVIIGLSSGFMVKLIFSGIEMAGQMIDFQVGYSMGAVFDPSTGTTSSYYGRVFYWMSITVFFILDIHHVLIGALLDSFAKVPPGGLIFGSFNLEAAVYVLSFAFKAAYSIAAPMLIVLLVTDIVMGLISRTVPQINVFMLGMPLKSLVGMVVFLVLISSLFNTTGKTLGLMGDFFNKTLDMFH
ncbi:MAG TPA: flagellar biosynthetic protein FliR [Eubacteriaceae bacterium]|jgi:flagellar biosynthetic protein FliR|nr:flagellar biosynthetic protein FliR [Eubacteriaceae bacterium]